MTNPFIDDQASVSGDEISSGDEGEEDAVDGLINDVESDVSDDGTNSAITAYQIVPMDKASKKRKMLVKNSRRKKSKPVDQIAAVFLYDSDNDESEPIPEEVPVITNTTLEVERGDSIDESVLEELDNTLDIYANNAKMPDGVDAYIWSKNFLGLPDLPLPLLLRELTVIEDSKVLPLFDLYDELLEKELIPSDPNRPSDPKQHERGKKIEQIREMIRIAIRIVQDTTLAKCISNGVEYTVSAGQYSMFRYGLSGSVVKAQAHQDVLRYLLKKAHSFGYKKMGDNIYRQTITADGHMTKSWEVHQTISKFVYSCITTNNSVEQWNNFTKSGTTASFCVNYLTKCCEYQLQFLVLDRYAVSFKNGVYLFDYLPTGLEDVPENTLEKFIPYENFQSNDMDIVSSKYFDQDFDNAQYDDWRDIQTPLFHSIFTSQKFDEETIEWMYVFMGRIRYELKKRDNWQLALFIKGIGGSGKSIIGQIIEQFFPDYYVYTFNCSTYEEKFGISAFKGKWAFVCQETAGKFGIKLDVLKSMIVGDKISFTEKGRTAESAPFTLSGAFFGNVSGDWVDESGAVARRFAIGEFNVSFTNGDEADGNPNLYDNIMAQEFSKLIRKFNLAYRDYSGRLNGSTIWSKLPKYFATTRNNLRCKANSLMSFMRDTDQLVATIGYPLHHGDIFRRYRIYCKQNSLTLVEQKEENLVSACNQLNIQVQYSASDIPYGDSGQAKRGLFIMNYQLGEL